MATAFPSSPMLKLARSAQSGVKVMTAAWQIIYTGSSAAPYIFAGAEIDLTTMEAGDTIEVRIRKQTQPLGNLIMHDSAQYLNAQPVNHVSIRVGALPDIYGIEIAMRQTTVGATGLKSIPMEAFDAKRIGLE